MSGTGWFVFVYIVSGCVFCIPCVWGSLYGIGDYLGALVALVPWPIVGIGFLTAHFHPLGNLAEVNLFAGRVGFVTALSIQALFFFACRRGTQHDKEISRLGQLEQSAKAARDEPERQLTTIADMIGQGLLEGAQQWSSPSPSRRDNPHQTFRVRLLMKTLTTFLKRLGSPIDAEPVHAGTMKTYLFYPSKFDDE